MRLTYHKVLIGLAFLCMVLVGTFLTASAEPEANEATSSPYVIADKLMASDKHDYDDFAYAIALSPDENVLVVGAPLRDVSSKTRQGEVYVYKWDGSDWAEAQKLTASDGGAEDNFGWSVDIAADYTIIIGAPDDDSSGKTDLGAAYIFSYNGSSWTQQSKLSIADSDAFSYDSRGESVAIASNGNTAFVGASGVEVSGKGRGAIYVLTRSGVTWTLKQRVLGPTDARRVGKNIHLSHDNGTLFAFGLYSINTFTYEHGSVHIYRVSGGNWVHNTELVPSDSAASDEFGSAITTSGDDKTLLIGAYGENQAFIFTGSGNSWTERKRLTKPDSFGHFGASVALNETGSQAAVGAWLNGSGGIQIYQGGGATWQNTQTLKTPDSRQEHLGFSLAMTGDGQQILGGARWAHSALDDYDPVGAVYVYSPGYIVYLPTLIK